MPELSVHSLAGVRERRKLLGLSAAQCGHAIGMTANAFNRVETGSRMINFPQGLSLARLLQCPAEKLCEGPSDDERMAVLHAQKAAAKADDPQPTAKRGRPAVWTREKALSEALAEARREASRIPTQTDDTRITSIDGVSETLAEREQRLRAMVEGSAPAPTIVNSINKTPIVPPELADDPEFIQLMAEWSEDDD